MWGKLECLVQTHVDPREQAAKSEANLPTMVLYGCCGNRCTVMDCNCNLLVKFRIWNVVFSNAIHQMQQLYVLMCFLKEKNPTLSFISLKKTFI